MLESIKIQKQHNVKDQLGQRAGFFQVEAEAFSEEAWRAPRTGLDAENTGMKD